MRVAKRGDDGLVHWNLTEGFGMAACSQGAGGTSPRYIVETKEALGNAPITCFWCLVGGEDDARIH